MFDSIRTLPQYGDDGGLALDNSSPYHRWGNGEAFPTTHRVISGSERERKQGGSLVQAVRIVKPLASWSSFECQEVLRQRQKIKCVMREVE